jgi:uracil-DNA glycosylase family 4
MPKYKLISKSKPIIEYNCKKCELFKKVKRPIVGWEGDPNHKLLFIDDSPNKKVDGGDIFFKGTLSEKLRKFQLKYKMKNILKGYAIQCCNTGSHSDIQAKCCRDKMARMIKELKPTAIISFGEATINSLLGTYNKLSIQALRGRAIPSHEFNCMIMPTYNSKEFRYIDEKTGEWKDNYSRIKAFDFDLEIFFHSFKEKYHNRKFVSDLLTRRDILKNKSITQVKTIKELEKVVEYLEEKKNFAFDYETTNNKPFDDDFEVISLCFAHENKAWAIYLDDYNGDLKQTKHITLSVLNNSDILKIIQNKQFEELSTRWWCQDIIDDYETNELGQVIINYFDTMLASHIVDERQSTTGLDFQTQVRFGISSFYDENKMMKWLKPPKGKKVNRIKECSKDLLIEYTGHDGIESYAHWKALTHSSMLGQNEKYNWCLNFISEGCDVFANMSKRGMPINNKKLKGLRKQFEDIKDNIQEKIENDKDIKGFTKSRRKSLNVQSPKQVRDFLYNYLKLTPIKKTKSGKKGIKEDATDASVIQHHAEKDNVFFCRQATKAKKLEKGMVVLNGIERWTCKDNKMHSSIWMNTTETMRSSSSDLNIQNIPVHGYIIEDEDHKIPWEKVREVFEREGQDYIIAEVDFERNEVVGAANLSGDKQLIDDINTDFDMHSHWTNVLFNWDHPFEAYKQDKDLENYRYLTKNNWTFANFYKAGNKSIAESFRKFKVYLDFLFKEYEKKKRPLSFEKWAITRSEEHISECQNYFFKRYSRYKEFQDETFQFYLDNRYIESALGFRRHYPLTATEIANFDIQATSYHILLDACTRIEKRLIKEKKESSQRAQIHDSNWLMIYLPEVLDIINLVNYEMTNHNLPNVPKLAKLGTEWKVGCNWGQMKKISSLL